MLSRIDEIPLQVEGMLTKTASDLSMQVDGGVVQMQDHLRISSGGQQVAENLENLPRHFATSVEANLMDAAALLRETVLQVTAELSARDFEAEDIVQEIQVIPQRVRKVADEAISRAVKTSVEELHQQLDEALGVLGSSTCEKELLQHLDQLPVVMQKRIVATGAVVDLAEDQIVDLAADLKSEFVPNHELMEALLRAKTAHEIGVVTLRYETDMEHEKVDTAQRLEKLKQTDESKFQNPGSSLASNFLGFLWLTRRVYEGYQQRRFFLGEDDLDIVMAKLCWNWQCYDSFWCWDAILQSGWWFQICFIFTTTWGNDPISLIFFKWVETTNS